MFHLCDEEKLGIKDNNFIIQIQGFGLSHQTNRLHRYLLQEALCHCQLIGREVCITDTFPVCLQYKSR